MIRNILFDLDGTLSESAPGIISSVILTLDQMGIAHGTAEELTWFIGPVLRESFIKAGVPRELSETAVEIYRGYYLQKGIYECRLYRGLREMLEALKGKVRIFLATAKPRIHAPIVLKHLGIDGYFEFIGGAELDGTRGRKSEVIRWVLDSCRLDPAETVMVGDRQDDRDGAAENGIPFVGVTYGYGTQEELSGAAALAHDAGELKDILLGMIG